MSLAEEMVADVRTIREDVGDSVQLQGYSTPVPALVSGAVFMEDLSLGGFEPKRTLTVKVLREELPALPKIGTTLRYDGVVYRISDIAGKPTLPLLTLTCQQT